MKNFPALNATKRLIKFISLRGILKMTMCGESVRGIVYTLVRKMKHLCILNNQSPIVAMSKCFHFVNGNTEMLFRRSRTHCVASMHDFTHTSYRHRLCHLQILHCQPALPMM